MELVVSAHKLELAAYNFFTEEEQHDFTLNTKEYIASAIDIEVQIDNEKFATPFCCILNRSYSSITFGWILKLNHDPIDAHIHNEVVRFHARNMMTRNACN